MNQKIDILDMENRIKAIMALVFKITADTIQHDTSRGTIDSWDSLAQLRLVGALEEEFAIEFSDEQVVGLRSYQQLVDAIEQLLSASDGI